MRRLKNKVYKGVQIKKVVFSDNPIGDKGAKYVCEYFEENDVIEHLEMNNTGLTEAGVLKLLEMFKACGNLKTISIANNEKLQKIV
jgi:Ran GTPase-activating protein (RanGAP) involved in mRNA processing and transport